ncbi:DNA ligase D [Sulfitobacter sp. D35]|uniref:DNA ligase D n=1 Tax=Sulfitobacter sp. D35 TaxID=3083252 RepID=UPI00296EA551|nr:DNA ligase D [Sulfitobacter sp. D35]MDW4496462.1 DNA ligase D [Sulfitobacter sp. D35]
MNGLEEYRRKRDFTSTPEPSADPIAAASDQLDFVVQKHAARRLHYDFRLEWGGVLLSWAVTKGPSADPSEKRLAVRTEDHPVSYGRFEGTIPDGNYGAGTVMLWDTGWWEPLHGVEDGLSSGKLHFRLHGARMQGGWVLVRLRGNQARENWLLIKERDGFAGRSADGLLNKHRTSVTTGRSLRAIGSGETAKARRRRKCARPRFRKLQLATLRDAPPGGEDWQHEVKFDGYRCLIAIGKGGVRLYTRNGKDWSDRFGTLQDKAEAIPCDAALIDGEVVAGSGGGNFAALQEALRTDGDLIFYGFDLLHHDGKDLTGLPLEERRAALERLLAPLPARGPIRLSPVIEQSGAEALAAICDIGGEGIVSKRRDAPYRAGRSSAWIKAKCVRRAEFVIVGWSPSDKRGRPFSSLLLASHEKGRLVYRGRVGTGFSEADLAALAAKLKALARKTAPLDGDLPSETADARWVTPRLVAEIAYTEFTDSGAVRHGVFHGLREDKSAREVSAAHEAETGKDAKVGGVRISSPERLVFPDADLTKADVARHYDVVAARMLEQVTDRPLALLRCPGGLTEDCFFQKHAGKGFPEAIRDVAIREKDGETAKYMYVTTEEGLVSAVQMGTIEFHLWGARRDRLERPDRLVFDLDPDEGLDFDAVRSAACEIGAALKTIGLDSAPMVTGGKGVHVIAPLRRISNWGTVKTFARTFATILAKTWPDRFTATMSKAARKRRIFVDWLRNDRGATAVAPYSLRARSGAAVAVPVTWDELAGLDRADGFHVSDIPERLRTPCPLSGLKATGIGSQTVDALEDWAETLGARDR